MRQRNDLLLLTQPELSVSERQLLRQFDARQLHFDARGGACNSARSSSSLGGDRQPRLNSARPLRGLLTEGMGSGDAGVAEGATQQVPAADSSAAAAAPAAAAASGALTSRGLMTGRSSAQSTTLRRPRAIRTPSSRFGRSTSTDAGDAATPSGEAHGSSTGTPQVVEVIPTTTASTTSSSRRSSAARGTLTIEAESVRVVTITPSDAVDDVR